MPERENCWNLCEDCPKTCPLFGEGCMGYKPGRRQTQASDRYSHFNMIIARILRGFDEWADGKERIDYATYDRDLPKGIRQAQAKLHELADEVQRYSDECRTGV